MQESILNTEILTLNLSLLYNNKEYKKAINTQNILYNNVISEEKLI